MKTILITLFIALMSLPLAALDLDKFPREAYHQLKSNAQTIGKTASQLEKSGDLYRMGEESLMMITLFKKEQSLRTTMSVSSDTEFRIQEFRYGMSSGDSSIEITGQRQGNKLRLEKTQAGKKQIKDIFIEEPLLLSPMIRPYVVSKLLPLKASKVYQAQLLEPSALVVIPMTLTIEPQAGTQNYKLQIEYLTHKLSSTISSNGALLSESTEIAGMPVSASPVTKAQYAKLLIESTKLDLVEQAKVQFPKLSDSRTRASLRVRLSGVPLHNFQLNRHRQALSGNDLLITKEKAPLKSSPAQSLVGKNEFQKYLKAEISIPVFEPQIQRKAQEIVGQESDLLTRAKLIHQFVFKHLKKDPYVSLPDAMEALESGKGDCNEHATLFTALARAAGVPTRTVVGLVYSDSFYGGGEAGFYYHAWVEIFTGEQWLSMDPTWNQIPADVTHIAFVEGGADQQIQIASLMGKIKLEKLADAPPVR